ncbi:MAG: hypothetical protein ACSHX6_07290 [Akkermansiaceae bacterium]
MEQSSNQQPQQRPPVRRPMDSMSGSNAPHDGLKQAAMSLKDSSLSYMQAKSELAAIEAKEAATYAKKKISIGIITAFFGVFSYALFLLLAYGVILQFAGDQITKISNIITLNESNTVILLMMIFHLFLFLIYLVKLSKKPQEELFALTKSEFQKDKQWLAEINQTNGN